jgi:sn-glycerol 3-phosphate transport system permease protein
MDLSKALKGVNDGNHRYKKNRRGKKRQRDSKKCLKRICPIFFLAGLSSIPRDVLEAAKLDGADPFQTFFRITLPLLSPTIFFVAVVTVINSFQSFGQIHILTGGGPAGATQTLVYSLYRDAFVNFLSGPASAEAILLFGILLLLTGVQTRVAKKRVHYG